MHESFVLYIGNIPIKFYLLPKLILPFIITTPLKLDFIKNKNLCI